VDITRELQEIRSQTPASHGDWTQSRTLIRRLNQEIQRLLDAPGDSALPLPRLDLEQTLQHTRNVETLLAMGLSGEAGLLIDRTLELLTARQAAHPRQNVYSPRRRTAKRWRIGSDVTLHEPGTGLKRDAKIVNVSRTGMQIETSEPLSVEIIIRIETAQRLYSGKVVYCVPDGPHFLAGLKLTEQ
jgi:hypothetical protein